MSLDALHRMTLLREAIQKYLFFLALTAGSLLMYPYAYKYMILVNCKCELRSVQY